MSSKKKGGSAKKSKKIDAEKLQAEEDERKRKADEEARLAEVRARKEREQKEQREKEALEQLFLQNKERLEEESQQERTLLDKHNGEIASAAKESLSEIEVYTKRSSSWSDMVIAVERFLDCHALPEPNNERELNTYLSLWKEESLGADDESSLQNLLHVLPNIEKINKRISISALRAHLLELRFMVQLKWDLVTTRVLQHVDHFQVEANENFQHSCGTDRYYFGVWGNLTKNPRFPIALANVSVRMLYETGFTASAPFQEQEGLNHYSISFDKWIIRQTNDEEEEGGGGQAADTNIWPTLVSYEIFPSCFIHKESAKIMSWQESEKAWSEENIGDVEINVELGHIKFRTTQFGPTALVQRTFAEYPFQHWELKPIDSKSTLLKVQGAVTEIEIEIREGACRLLKPTTKYLESVLKGELMSPSLLFHVGLNFLGPTTLKDSGIDHVIIKNPAVEEACELGIGLCASFFSFRRSPSNRNVSSSKVVFQIQDGVQKDDDGNIWKNLIFDGNYKVGEKTIKIAYFSQEAEMHSTISGKSRCQSESTSLLSRTVTDVLRLMRLFSFS
ncbi:hypothetical protein BC829DRAFT_399161 [Chytridium lagenaria]|nr:hypothetical protein BC829DRAFT_399161 [Chytridium lagenaria]